MMSGLSLNRQTRGSGPPARRMRRVLAASEISDLRVCPVKFADETALIANFIRESCRHRPCLSISLYIDRFRVPLEFDYHLKEKRYIIFLRPRKSADCI